MYILNQYMPSTMFSYSRTQPIKFGKHQFSPPSMSKNWQISPSYRPDNRESQVLNPLEPTGTIISIGYPQFHKATLDKALSTGNIVSCSALIVINKKQNWHYLAHINPTTNFNILAPHFKAEQLNLPDSEYYILPGNWLDSERSTTEEILRALHEIDPDLPDKVHFVYFPREARSELVVSQAGDLGYFEDSYYGPFKYNYENQGQHIPGARHLSGPNR